MVPFNDTKAQASDHTSQASSTMPNLSTTADSQWPAYPGALGMQAATKRLRPEPDLTASSQQPADSDPLDEHVACHQPLTASELADIQNWADSDAQSDVGSLRSTSSSAYGLPTSAPLSKMARVLSIADQAGMATDLSLCFQCTAYLPSDDSDAARRNAFSRTVWLCRELPLSLIDEYIATHYELEQSLVPLTSYFFSSDETIMSDRECSIWVPSQDKSRAREVKCAVVKSLGVALILNSSEGDLKATGRVSRAIGEIVPECIPKKSKAMDIFKKQAQSGYRLYTDALILECNFNVLKNFTVGLFLHQPYNFITEEALNSLKAENCEFSHEAVKGPGHVEVGSCHNFYYSCALTMEPCAQWPFSGEVFVCKRLFNFDMIVGCIAFEKSKITGSKHIGRGVFKMEPYNIYGKFEHVSPFISYLNLTPSRPPR